MKKEKIPIYKPFLGEEENQLVAECMQSTWISSQGKFIRAFEEGVEVFTKAEHAIAVSNGTVAIHLAMLALDIGKGDEVITTNFTYVASTNAVLYVGATPVFVDIDPLSWNIDPSKIEAKISSKTKAILYTNIYGCPAEYFELKRIAEKHGLYLIEDAAESFGAKYQDKMSGVLGDVSTYSFFGNKTITTGEGGMVLTPHIKLAEKIRKLKNQGNSETIRYYHDILGYNYRMTNVQAAIGLAQLGKIDEILQLKAALQRRYEEGLNDFVKFQKLPENTTSSYWMCSVVFKTAEEKEAVVMALNSANVETRPFFIPIDELPFYEKVDNCPNAKEVSLRGLNLPSYPALSEIQQERIIETIKNNIN